MGNQCYQTAVASLTATPCNTCSISPTQVAAYISLGGFFLGPGVSGKIPAVCSSRQNVSWSFPTQVPIVTVLQSFQHLLLVTLCLITSLAPRYPCSSLSLSCPSNVLHLVQNHPQIMREHILVVAQAAGSAGSGTGCSLKERLCCPEIQARWWPFGKCLSSQCLGCGSHRVK